MAEQTRPSLLIIVFGIFSVSALAIVKRLATAGLQVNIAVKMQVKRNLAHAEEHHA